MRQLLTFIQKCVPGCENAFLISTASALGVRETRRIVGDFVLTEEHIGNKTQYDDAIARIWRHHAVGRGDPHPPEPIEGAESDRAHRHSVSRLHWFFVPYRTLIPQKVRGLLVAGRTISQTQAADMWTRGQFCCMVTGQAAGTAAALAAQEQRELDQLDVKRLQENLKQQGVEIE
jgi:hypothetical protein